MFITTMQLPPPSQEQTPEQALAALKTGTNQVVGEDELLAKLKEKRPLRIKLGFDPSSPDLHLGHVLVLDKIRQFQDFGHTAVIIIGEYTARIGDPTGRSKTRKPLEPEEIKHNALTYTEQVFKILIRDRTEIRSNSEWFDRFTYADVLKLNARMSVAQLLERDDFAKRYRENQPLSLAEFQYPLMQGHDSVMVRADVEIGGNDQLFNNLVGRDLQRSAGQPPQTVIVLPILTGTDGSAKMSKSLGNSIGILENPTDMFGKAMSISDPCMEQWWQLIATSYHLPEPPEHPMQKKKTLAAAIVSRFHGEQEAKRVREDFENKFSKNDLAAADIPETPLDKTSWQPVELIRALGAASSNGEARRLIAGGALKIDGQKIPESTPTLELSNGAIVQCGKKFFAKIKLIP